MRHNGSRLLLLILRVVSLLCFCHALTTTKSHSGASSRRYLEHTPALIEDTGSGREDDVQPVPPRSNVQAILEAMNPPPNCTSFNTSGSLFLEEKQPRRHQLECFLWKLKVRIPAQSFDKGWLTLTVHDMMCTNFRLHGLLSNSSVASLLRDDDDLSELNLSIQNLSATCQGSYHSTGRLAGNILATVTESSSLPSQALELLVGVRGQQSKGIHDYQRNHNSKNSNSSDSIKLPSAFETMECGTHLECQSIDFSGSISAKLVQAFSGKIGGYITQTLQQQVCPSMTQSVDPIVTAYFKQFDDLVRPYLEEAVAIVDAIAMNDASASMRKLHEKEDKNLEPKNLIEYPVMKGMLNFLNDQLRYHLQTGWIPLPPPSPSVYGGYHSRMSQECIDSFRGISGWIISFLGYKPRISLPQNLQHLVFSIPNEIGENGTIVLDIPEVIVEGLDKMDILQILEPSKSKDLITKLVTKNGFSVALPIDMKLHWPAAKQTHGLSSGKEIDASAPPTLKESFRLTINVTHIDASFSSFIKVINWESTSLLQVVDTVQRFIESRNVLDLACLVNTLHSVDLFKDGSLIFRDILIDAISLSRDKKDVPEGSLEADLDHTINSILDLSLTDYADLWTRLVRGLARGPVSHHLNRIIEEWIQKHSNSYGEAHSKCPPAVSSPGQWVNFTKFEVLKKFNRYLDHSEAKKSLNDFLQCIAESIEDAVDGDDDGPAYDHNFGSDEYRRNRLTSDKFTPSHLGNVIDYNRNLPASFSDSLKDGINLFLESGKMLATGNDTSEKRITLSAIKLRNWDSIEQLQIMKPSGDTSLVSSFVYEKNATQDVADVEIYAATLSSKGPPEITLVVDADTYKVSGQVNITLFVSLDANAEINIDYDLNRLENLTISHLFEEISCALLPAMQIRFLPGTTNLVFGEYLGANITAAFGERRFSMSTCDLPRFLEISTDVLSWYNEFSRTIVNYAIEELINISYFRCPGVVVPDDDHHSKENHGGKSANWTWRESTILWVSFGLVVILQGGLVFLYRSQHEVGVIQESIQENDCEEFVPYQDSEISEQNRQSEHDNCQDWGDVENDEPQGILEDQLVEELEDQLVEESPVDDPKISLFESEKIPEIIKYLVPSMVTGTIALFLFSNLNVGASVDLSTSFGERLVGIPGLFQFSLGNTISEMYMAGIYPLLILVLCFSGIWPYVKLLAMIYSWMTPTYDQYQRESRLLTLDAMGKYSLVDIYVLILFVVAFRFHLGISDNLGIDVYVTPTYGFFSFLFATCISLMLGHAVLFFHRKTMHEHNENTSSPTKTSLLNHSFKALDGDSHLRLSWMFQVFLLLFVIISIGFLIVGFFQNSYTFEIGGLAGIMLGEDVRRTSYSVLSLGAALPSSVEASQSLSILFLQVIFFFFTVVMPLLCLILIMVLMSIPLTLKWQRYLLIAAEIANSWSAVEVFLLSILAALFQISTFASFMIGDKCDEVDILAKKIFPEDPDTVCFTVDASVESNCWYLLVGALANFFTVSFCLDFAEAVVKEKLEISCNETESTSSPNTNRHRSTLIQKICKISFFDGMIFTSIDGSHSSLEEDLIPSEEDLVPLEEVLMPLENNLETTEFVSD